MDRQIIVTTRPDTDGIDAAVRAFSPLVTGVSVGKVNATDWLVVVHGADELTTTQIENVVAAHPWMAPPATAPDDPAVQWFVQEINVVRAAVALTPITIHEARLAIDGFARRKAR